MAECHFNYVFMHFTTTKFVNSLFNLLFLPNTLKQTAHERKTTQRHVWPNAQQNFAYTHHELFAEQSDVRVSLLSNLLLCASAL